MFDTDPAVLDADATPADVVAARRVAEQAEVRILCDAARWADLHARLDNVGTGVSLPGTEQQVVDRVEHQHERLIVTRNGHAAAS